MVFLLVPLDGLDIGSNEFNELGLFHGKVLDNTLGAVDRLTLST